MSFDVNPLDDNPDPHGECRREIEHLQSFKKAYEIWQEKTDWVQEQADGFPFPVLGMHRADVMRKEIDRLQKIITAIRTKLESIVCTVAPDEGVVLLSQDSPTHTEVIRGRAIEVYDHEYFSPLGDALIELWKLTK